MATNNGNTQGFDMLIDEGTRRRLEDLRLGLLRLHKALLEAEKESYEREHGAIGGAGNLLNLLMTHPWFDWLHQISEFVVQIDELLESEDASVDDAYGLIDYARNLFKPGDPTPDEDSAFMRKYKAALQRDPGIIMLHAEVQKTLLPES